LTVALPHAAGFPKSVSTDAGVVSDAPGTSPAVTAFKGIPYAAPMRRADRFSAGSRNVGLAGNDWEKTITEARKEFQAKVEGPPAHLETPMPTLEDQLAALRVAGFGDVRVIWCSSSDVLFMARKR